jgi:hypothetical protein
MSISVPNTTHSETEILFAVENFISSILVYGFKPELKPEFKQLLELFDGIYNIDHYYFDYVDAFIRLKMMMDEVRHDKIANPADNYDFVLNFDDEQLAFYDKIIKLYKGDIQRDLYQFWKQEEKNKASLFKYVDSFFNHYTKLLIVRVDLGYLNESKQQIDIRQFYSDFEVMRNRISNQDTIFNHLHGYAWALEQAKDRGYHVHLLLIYDGAKVQSDSFYAQRVGETWQQITKGHGSYFNLHSGEYIHELRMAGCDIGLGMLSRKNEGDWDRLVQVIEYLTDSTKDAQRLRVKLEKNMNAFGKGQFENTKRRGIRRDSKQDS